MARVVLSRLARQDLELLWLRIAATDIGVADRISEALEKRLAMLSDYPEMAPARPDIAPDLRALVVERWLVLYRIAHGEVQVGRIVDSARDLGKLSWTEATWIER